MKVAQSCETSFLQDWNVIDNPFGIAFTYQTPMKCLRQHFFIYFWTTCFMRWEKKTPTLIVDIDKVKTKSWERRVTIVGWRIFFFHHIYRWNFNIQFNRLYFESFDISRSFLQTKRSILMAFLRILFIWPVMFIVIFHAKRKNFQQSRWPQSHENDMLVFANQFDKVQ